MAVARLALLLASGLSCTVPTVAAGALLSQEIRYHMPEAGEVLLGWGINGWQTMPEALRPPGTVIRHKVMFTPMSHVDETFTVEARVPPRATIDYGFLITKARGGGSQGHDYHSIATPGQRIEVTGNIRLKQSSPLFDLGLYLSLGIVILLGIWLLISALPWGPRKAALIFAVNVLPVAIVVFLGDVYLRGRGFVPYIRAFPGQHQADPRAGVVSDPVLGWTSNKNGPEINPQGFRDPTDFTRIDLNSGKSRVMIVGDSFMLGVGVAPTETVAGRLQAQLGASQYECFNLSAPGWGLDQMYLAYEQYKDVIKPDAVIVAFIDDDVNRVLEAFRFHERVAKPSFALENGTLVPRRRASRTERVLNKLMARSVFFSLFMREVYLFTEARPLVRRIFRELASDVERRGARLVVVRIPMVWDDPYNNTVRGRSLNDFAGVFGGTHVIYLDVAAEMARIPNWQETLYLGNGHLSVLGNQFLADYIHGNAFKGDRRVVPGGAAPRTSMRSRDSGAIEPRITKGQGLTT